MSKRRPTEPAGLVLWQLGGLTVSIAAASCHGCGRNNAGLEYESRRVPKPASPRITICNECMGDILAAHMDFRANWRTRT